MITVVLRILNLTVILRILNLINLNLYKFSYNTFNNQQCLSYDNWSALILQNEFFHLGFPKNESDLQYES